MRYGPSQLDPNFPQAEFMVVPKTFLNTKSPDASGLALHLSRTLAWACVDSMPAEP